MNFRKLIGYTLLVISFLALILLPAIPFLSLGTSSSIALATGLTIVAEACWWLAVPLLGKDFLQWGKRFWGKLTRKPSDSMAQTNRLSAPHQQSFDDHIHPTDKGVDYGGKNPSRKIKQVPCTRQGRFTR
ncbi:transporter suffix domain-containing protein [Pseudomaricurvus alkylphenolicus]|jgi:hypothetical protein|uniref:transporter suffix domain-containing protein n=1 Tax=Pseudomaricurvus alkylphenolicus TaxID=1306991 RepID=UPI00141DA4D4|nr:transporter suffix domain-containing protein [Pseudomaricurvus alkylphenolicus]